MTVSSVSSATSSYQLYLQQLQQQQQQQQQTAGAMPQHHHHGGGKPVDQGQQATGQSASATLSALTGGADSDGDSASSSLLNIVA